MYEYETFTRNRITQLRMQKGVSAREMSLSLGQNGSYINRIENNKALPSLSALFNICEYCGLTPKEFFDEGNAYPNHMSALIEELKKLDASALETVTAMVKQLNRGR